jgi:ABC transporter with metal-binding/Fe-S-binding domain ATP-binding protein
LRGAQRFAILFSGGKDSTLALHRASEIGEVACLITILSRNNESYMFHTPNIHLASLQAEALGLPIIQKTTNGLKETELADLTEAISSAVIEFNVDCIVSGAVESVYQNERVHRICRQLNVECFNPLWHMDQKALLEELVTKEYEIILSGIFAYPLNKDWLGKRLNKETIEKLLRLSKEYGLSPAGEGGEIETTVLDAPLFKRRIEILEYAIEAKENCGLFVIQKARLVPK